MRTYKVNVDITTTKSISREVMAENEVNATMLVLSDVQSKDWEKLANWKLLLFSSLKVFF